MDRLTPLAKNIWVVDQPRFRMLGLQLGTRTTVVKMDDGSLWVHSPIALDDALAAELADLGPIGNIIAPNAFHHVYIADWKRAYPEARLWGAQGLIKKRRDVTFNAVLGRDEGAWPFRSCHIPGTLLDETVFLHEPSGTLIHADLFENFNQCDHGLTRLYLKLGGVWQKPGLHPLLRPIYRNRSAAREAVKQVLEWDFDRVILAHGDIVTEKGRDVAEQGMAWLMR